MGNALHNMLTYIKKSLLPVVFLIPLMVVNQEVNAQSKDSISVVDDVAKQQNFDPSTTESKQTIQTRNVDQSQVEKIRRDNAFWYVNTSPVREEARPPSESFLNKLVRQHWFRNLMWFLMIGSFIAVVIWFLLSSNVKLFKKRSFSTTKSENNTVIENIFEINYSEEIYKAVNAENYRLAIRLMYLQLLKDLSQKEIIQYKQERTNNDYVAQLNGTDYHKSFFHLTRNFEYVWYGQFKIKTEAFKTMQSDFVSFKNKLP